MRQVMRLICSCVLAGCTSVPLTSIPKLLALQPDTLDIMQVQVAVRMNEDMRLYKDEVILALNMDIEGEEPHTIRLNLQPVEDDPLPEALQRQRKDGFQLARFKVDPSDSERAMAYRERALELRALGRKGGGSVYANAGGCIRQGANPFQSIRMKVYLRPETDAEFFPVLRDTKVDLKFDDESGPGVEFCKAEDADRILTP